jgi:hypothetical protein
MFFNPAQTQSSMNSPMFQQMMAQMQGGGMLQQPAMQQMQNMAPQMPPMANPHPGAAPQGVQPPAQGGAPPGFFGQMMQSPQNMQSGLSSMSTLAGLPGMMGSWGAEAAGPMMSGAAGYGTGTGILGGLQGLGSFLGLL